MAIAPFRYPELRWSNRWVADQDLIAVAIRKLRPAVEPCRACAW